MSNTQSEPEEAITEEEIAGTATPRSQPPRAAEPRNAFSELMAPKAKAPPLLKPGSWVSKAFNPRDALGAYILYPASDRVIYHNDDFVAIHDLYPKASVHVLLLPRSSKYTLQHPVDAFNDAAFLVSVKAEALKTKAIAAKELQRQFGAFSKAEEARNAVLTGQVEADELPAGRDWEAEVKVGIHAHPSMNHLHVHIMSRDMHSPCMKHKKHYNSFNTSFLIGLDDFPLAADDRRRHMGHWPDEVLRCWRCGKEFGNKFKALKVHIEMEFEEWKKE